MQAPGDNSITVADSHVQTYADNNLNEKNIATQYIYTTEGQLIPTTPEQVSTNMDINSQHYNTVHVAEAQDMHIQSVDYQYQQQYPDGTVQQVVPVSGTAFVQDQTTAYMIDQTTFIPANPQDAQTTEQQVYPDQVVTEETPESTTYVYETTQVQENYGTDQPVVTETEFVSEHATNEDNQENIQQTVEPGHDNNETVTENFTPISETVEEATENVESAQTAQSEEVVSKQVSEVAKDAENVTESGIQENIANIEVQDEVVETIQQEVIEEESSTVSTTESHSTEQTQNEQLSNNLEEEQVQDELVVEESSSSDQPSEVTKDALTEVEAPTEQNVPVTDYQIDGPVEVQESLGMGEDNASLETAPLENNPAYVIVTTNKTESKNSAGSSTEPVQHPAQQPRPRGRRPKTDIPLHILGHDVNKPMENIVNGKTPKPRLGVKVPYRNLTSQIVSKEELEREIVERGRKKQEEKKEEIMFARQLTSRLAKKIAPESSGSSSTSQSKANVKKDKPPEVEVVVLQEDQQMDVDDNDNEENPLEKQTDSIDNNSDLLAILEGDGDTEDLSVLPKETEPQNKESTPTDETNLKNLEREIALQQLQDLPYLSPSTRFMKGKLCTELPPSLSEGKTTKPQSGKTSNSIKQTSVKEKSSIKGSPVKQSADRKSLNLDKKTMEVEPQIKVNMALKTYSRKRKSSDSVTELAASPSKKLPVVVNTAEIDLKPNVQTSSSGEVYVTKSSRVIKKKVIWDPDESIPSRLTSVKSTSIKAESPAFTKPISKPVQPKNENRTADLTKKSAVEIKVKTEKKAEEKPMLKKSSPAEKRVSPGSKAAMKPKKSRSEVDKLLGDEGAIKMLYDLKTSDDHVEEKRKKTVISVEKTFKELAKKANQIKSDLVNTTIVESPKSLRKKEPVISPVVAGKPISSAMSVPVVPSGISRQKSKDSSRSTPPPSPSFSFPNETSYLIRRRSSSSISSGGDTGGSIEFDDTEDRSPRKKTAATPSTDPLKIKKSKKNSETHESERSQKRAESRIGHYTNFSFKKLNRSITIDLYTDKSPGCYLTSELLDELTTALNKISKERDCNVVLIRSSQSSTFSRGLDYKELISDKESIRKNKATELAKRVSNFIHCLLDFPKILVAGIQGECAGLAVTMLPLFDIVIGSDNATFSTQYSTLGSVAEAGFLLTVPHLASYGLAGELFYASQKLTADEVFRRGLISKLCWPEKYNDTVKATLMSVAKGSKQSLESTKKQLRSRFREVTKEAIDSMSNQLVEHWTSNECQNSFAKIVE